MAFYLRAHPRNQAQARRGTFLSPWTVLSCRFPIMDRRRPALEAV